MFIYMNIISQYCRFDSFFNWTMTYRIDSDIFMPYGYIAPKNPAELRKPPYPPGQWLVPDFQNLPPMPQKANNSSAFISWIASNCHSKSDREIYVEVMKVLI